MEFSRPEYWSGQPFPSPGNLPNSGIKPRSSALQVDSLPAEPQGEPKSVLNSALQSPPWWRGVGLVQAHVKPGGSMGSLGSSSHTCWSGHRWRGGISCVAVLHTGSELGLFLAPLCLLCQLHPSPLVSTHTSLCGGMDVPTGIHVIICTREHTKTSLQNAVFSVMFQSP